MREEKKNSLHKLIRVWKERGGGSWVLIPFKNKEEKRILKNVTLKIGDGIVRHLSLNSLPLSLLLYQG